MNTKTLGVSLFLVALFLLFIKAFDISYPLKVNLSNSSGELSVVGEGKVDVVPDIAYIDAGVVVSGARTMDGARGKIDEVNNKLIESVKKLGISSSDIKTTNYSINPSYTYENNTNKITGFDGNATITIKTKKTDAVPLIVEAATVAGANQINNTRFVVDTPEKYREAAREAAIKNAKDQAAKIAKSLGITLGRVTNVVESIGSGGVVYPMDSKSFPVVANMGSAPTFEAGTETITSTVTLFFEKR